MSANIEVKMGRDGYIWCNILPAIKVKRFLLLVPMLCVEVCPQMLRNQSVCLVLYNERSTNSENHHPGHSHTIIGFDPFLAKVDCGRRPVGIAVVNRNEDNIFREDIDLGIRRQYHYKPIPLFSLPS